MAGVTLPPLSISAKFPSIRAPDLRDSLSAERRSGEEPLRPNDQHFLVIIGSNRES